MKFKINNEFPTIFTVLDVGIIILLLLGREPEKFGFAVEFANFMLGFKVLTFILLLLVYGSIYSRMMRGDRVERSLLEHYSIQSIPLLTLLLILAQGIICFVVSSKVLAIALGVSVVSTLIVMSLCNARIKKELFARL